MTTTALLTAAATAATSADFTVAPAAVAYLYAKPATTLVAFGVGWNIDIQKKTGTDYYTVDSLTGIKPAVVLSGAGTFRLSRPVTQVAVGCDQET
jgi:hypothetical protein